MVAARTALVLLAFTTGASQALAGSNPAPSNLVFSWAGAQVHLTWLPPEPGSGNTQVKLLRRLNAAPTGPNDAAADLLYAGPASGYSHPTTDLLPDVPASPRTYHYAVFGCDASGTTCEGVGSRTSVAPSLAYCLRGGGYTIYWRHADADVCLDRLDLGKADTTSVPNWWRTCDTNCLTTTARQLNASGVQHATTIGQNMRALGIPVGRVLSSEYCRCLDTAELMDLGPPVDTDSTITYFVYDESNRCTYCNDRIREVPAQGTNTAIIGHAGFGAPCPILGALQWGQCAIFKPDGSGGAASIAQLLWDDWGGMATDVPQGRASVPATVLDIPYETVDGIRIRYRIASGDRQFLRLEIFDVGGRRLWSTRPEWRGAGAYEQTWDRRDPGGHEVKRGILFVRLSTGSTVLSRKALVLGRGTDR